MDRWAVGRHSAVVKCLFPGWAALLLPLLLLLVGTGCARREVVVVVLPPIQVARAYPHLGGAFGLIHPEPYYREGERWGVRVRGVQPRSLADRMGLEDGDIIVEMQGVPCDRLARCRQGARRLRRALRRLLPFALEVERRGTVIEIRTEYDEVRPVGM